MKFLGGCNMKSSVGILPGGSFPVGGGGICKFLASWKLSHQTVDKSLLKVWITANQITLVFFIFVIETHNQNNLKYL